MAIFVTRRGDTYNFRYKKRCLGPDVKQKCPGLVRIWSELPLFIAVLCGFDQMSGNFRYKKRRDLQLSIQEEAESGNFCYMKRCLVPDVKQKCPGLVRIWSELPLFIALLVISGLIRPDEW